MRIPTPLTHPFDGVGRAAAHLVTGVLVQFGALLVMAVPWLDGGPTKASSCLLALAVMAGVLGAACPVLTRAQRARFRARLGVEIPVTGRPWSWRQVGYHLAAGPLIALGGALTLLLWAAAAAAATVYVWVWALPPETRSAQAGYAVQAAFLTAAGLAGLYGAAWLSRALARLDTRAATARLGPSRAEVLEQRVEEVAASRAGVVDAADAERRRIERDLHDGAQQRLVSMAVNLGLAKATLKDLPEEARQVIDEAHREAKEAIAELGNLVRGLHPAVLEDRGLDAALSGIAERTPLPVGLTVGLADRPAPTVEAVAYFVVSEALANVVKHARATRADVRVEQRGGILLVVVTDDGVGGADPTGGSGLAGLAKRVASVDGTFSISSPVGGPTVVTVELPCAL
ncbi:sensor histidine kinase [Streptomyces rectiverticillatus]|uniref:sensor histidine kinase n=1 Tax=Streptomyces rectiverticillatus TaxID=173860 RepID=UPI0015C2F217|nr:sensor histidine kinase [Streptomyces rectiverticillatus]QLE71973.1 sensor histidine kinase [Streptomyces rectiverticillatus]